MNFLLNTCKEDAERSAGAPSCLYCKQVFNSPQALGGHLKAHQEEMKSGGILNHPGHASSSVDITRTNPYSILNCQPQYSSSVPGNNLTQFVREPSLWGPSERFSIESDGVDASKFPGKGLEKTKTQFCTSPDLSSSNTNPEFYHSNSLSPISNAIYVSPPAMSSPVFASPSSIMGTGFSSDHSSSVGRNEICQFNTDNIQTFPGALPYPFRGALPNFQGHEFNKLPYPTSVMIIPYPCPTLGSNQSPCIKEPTTTGSHSFLPSSHPCSCRNEVSLCDNENVLTCKRAKRLNLCDAPVIADANQMNASKRSKIISNPPVESENSQMKDIPLSVDVEKSFSALGVSVDAEEKGHSTNAEEKGHSTNAEEEDHIDLDLSLHL